MIATPGQVYGFEQLMFADLKPYYAYKPSGVLWLGDVPEHWEIRRVRTIASVVNGGTPSSMIRSYWDGGIVWLTPQDLGALGDRRVQTSGRRITREGYEACGATLAPADSVAISTRAPIGYVGVLGTAACTNQGCRLLVPNDSIQSDYLYYGIKVVRPELESFGQGTTFAELSRDRLAGFPVTLPPLPEQATIVRFLDHADRRIRRYIRAKQKLIALLEEQKQALIHQAVTGQIDIRTGRPYPAYKDSGVEWLGDVPEHWNTRPLKRWVTINAEVLPETTAPDRVFRYVDIGSVGTGTLTQETQWLRFAGAPSRARRVVHNGDTLVSTVRTYLKAIYFVDGETDELVCSTGFAVLTPRVGTVPQFVSYLARSNAFTQIKSRRTP